MADEKNTPNEIAEFEEKSPAQTGNKDLWLFLIVVDVVLLCVFGFFLYKNLSAMLITPRQAVPTQPQAVAETWAEEEVPATLETVLVSTETSSEEQPTPEKQVDSAKEGVAAPEEKAPSGKEASSSAPKSADKTPEATAEKTKAAAAPAKHRDSVVVTGSAKSQYRQVTFRYFETAKSVAIVSGFTMAKPRAMTKKGGVWEVTLAIAPGTYKYLFIVDGKQKADPYGRTTQDGRSVLTVK